MKEREGWISARAVIEILGAPKEHIETTLREFIGNLKEDNDIRIDKEDYAEAKKHEELFTSFVELEISFRNIPRMFVFCFEAMPSSIEILDPMTIPLQSAELSGYINDLQARLHTLDMALKQAKAENEVLNLNADALFRNLIINCLRENEKEISQISKESGIKEEHLKPLLEKLKVKGYISEENAKYKRK